MRREIFLGGTLLKTMRSSLTHYHPFAFLREPWWEAEEGRDEEGEEGQDRIVGERNVDCVVG